MNHVTLRVLWVVWMSCVKIHYAVNCLAYIPLGHQQFCELAMITEVQVNVLFAVMLLDDGRISSQFRMARLKTENLTLLGRVSCTEAFFSLQPRGCCAVFGQPVEVVSDPHHVCACYNDSSCYSNT